MTQTVDQTVRDILCDVLGLDADRTAALDDDSGLFGTLPEFDSMAVASVLTEMEDRLAITIDDDEIDADLFATYGALRSFASDKVASRLGG